MKERGLVAKRSPEAGSGAQHAGRHRRLSGGRRGLGWSCCRRGYGDGLTAERGRGPHDSRYGAGDRRRGGHWTGTYDEERPEAGGTGGAACAIPSPISRTTAATATAWPDQRESDRPRGERAAGGPRGRRRVVCLGKGGAGRPGGKGDEQGEQGGGGGGDQDGLSARPRPKKSIMGRAGRSSGGAGRGGPTWPQGRALHAAPMANVPGRDRFAEAAVAGALDAGARYADARVMIMTTESMSAQNGEIEGLRQGEQAGIGVRALMGSSWGFAATADLSATGAARRAGQQAAGTARASARVPGAPLEMAPVPAIIDHWENECAEDPLCVPLSEKADLLGLVTTTARQAGAGIAQASYEIWDTRKWLATSEGSRISQRIRECGAALSATAVGDSETQRRSYPGIRGQYGTKGWELVRQLDLPGNAGRIGEEAVALLSAPVCPERRCDLILGTEQMALQIHESVGHATELDRILGWEAAFAGTSWLELPKLGSLRFGSELMNITADATLPGALGSFGYDDEGTPAHPVDIVRDGIWVGALSGRDSAALAGLPAGGMVRSDGHNRIPMVRMTNIGILPGASSLEQMIAETEDGIYMDTNRSWSIDDRRLNFQFGCEVAYEVKDGALGQDAAQPDLHRYQPAVLGISGPGRQQRRVAVLGHA